MVRLQRVRDQILIFVVIVALLTIYFKDMFFERHSSTKLKRFSAANPLTLHLVLPGVALMIALYYMRRDKTSAAVAR